MFVRLASIAVIATLALVQPAAAVVLQNATATFSQNATLEVGDTIDGIALTGGLNGWAVSPAAAQTAVWETETDVTATSLTFTLQQLFGTNHTIGRFRLSTTTDDRSTFADGLANGGDVTATWTELVPNLTSLTVSPTPATYVIIDNSILLTGPLPLTATYTVQFDGLFVGITGIRLEVIEDASLPATGPGRSSTGNFVLSEFSLESSCAENEICFFQLSEPGSFAILCVCLLGLGLARFRSVPGTPNRR